MRLNISKRSLLLSDHALRFLLFTYLYVQALPTLMKLDLEIPRNSNFFFAPHTFNRDPSRRVNLAPLSCAICRSFPSSWSGGEPCLVHDTHIHTPISYIYAVYTVTLSLQSKLVYQ